MKILGETRIYQLALIAVNEHLPHPIDSRWSFNLAFSIFSGYQCATWTLLLSSFIFNYFFPIPLSRFAIFFSFLTRERTLYHFSLVISGKEKSRRVSTIFQVKWIVAKTQMLRAYLMNCFFTLSVEVCKFYMNRSCLPLNC